MKHYKRIYWFLAIWLLVWGCKPKDGPDPNKNSFLVESSLITELSQDQLRQQLQALNPLIAAFVRNGVKAYRITYKTKNTDGKEITASGALVVPVTTQPAAMVSVQHGTITDDAQAPSYFNSSSEAYLVGSLFGSLGYIIAYPDYIGYGASKDVPHPYEHRASLASASLDMIRAAREFLAGQNGITWDKRLYLTGYSEGGFATLSLQKKIEEETGTEFNLRASSCGAGAYDKTATMRHLVSQQTSGQASNNSLYLWVLLTYDRVYGLNRPLDRYFKQPYLASIQQQRQNARINVPLNTIFTDAFAKGVLDGTDMPFINAVKDNDVHDWRPRTPTRLYHGTADPLVFFFNSQNAFDAMRARGATQVTLVPLQGRDHGTAINDFLLGTFEFFSATP
jgi:fermentation-respiration switch protein FrsA (DUF1100 family)